MRADTGRAEEDRMHGATAHIGDGAGGGDGFERGAAEITTTRLGEGEDVVGH